MLVGLQSPGNHKRGEMMLNITKDSIDLGIVIKEEERSLHFYRDVLGLPYQTKLDMPGGMVMHRLLAGTSVVKLLVLPKTPAAEAAPGGIVGGTGLRYFTISVSNLEQAVASASQADAKIAISPREVRPGVTIAMIEDPDGNWVELLEES